MNEVKDFVDKTLLRVTGEEGGAEVVMVFDDGHLVRFNHQQNCCESVCIESIVGNLQDLVGTPLLRAEVKISEEVPEGHEPPSESATWTFYTFATRKGYVDIRWIGESNGYYSEGVDMTIHKMEIHEFVHELKGLNYE